MPSFWQQSKTEFKEAMIKAGLWDKVILRREALKKEGMPAKDAMDRVMQEFGSGQQATPAECALQPAPTAALDAEPLDDVPTESMVPPDADGRPEPAITEKLNPSDVAWALAHIDDNKPPKAPSLAARAWWSWANSGTLARQAFMTQVVPKLFPSKKELDEATIRKGDDGRDLADWYDELADLRDGIPHPH